MTNLKSVEAGRKAMSVLPLFNGDRMKQPEFHRRYEQYPDDVKFELIGGIVYMASPARATDPTQRSADNSSSSK